MTSQLKVDRISPATGSEIIIDGFESGGITSASQWRLTTDFAGAVDPISSNLESVSSPLGPEMTQENGIFTFPEVGYWYVEAYADWTDDPAFSSLGRSRIYISTTTNNSTYAVASSGWGGTYYIRSTGACSYIMNVTDVTQCKVKFSVSQATATVVTNGDTDFNDTFFTFIRLAGN